MKRRDTEGAFSITSRGIEASAPSLGAAISKAITFASRMQLKGEPAEGEVQSIYVRKIGGEIAARIDVKRDLIQTFAVVATR